MRIFLALLLLLSGCTQPTQTSTRPPVISPEDCPPLPESSLDETGGLDYAHYRIQVSKTGKWVAYKLDELQIRLLDPITLHDEQLVADFPDDPEFYDYGDILWSPYDEDLLLVEALVRFDTGGVKKVTGQKMYLVNVKTKAVKDITPFGSRYGLHFMTVVCWLAGSQAGNDSIVGSYVKHRDSKGGDRIQGVYLTKQSIISPRRLFETKFNSFAGTYFVSTASDIEDIISSPFQLNGRPSVLDSFRYISNVSWSPDERYMAVEGAVRSDSSLNYKELSQVWVVDMDEATSMNPRPIRLNLHRSECMLGGGRSSVMLTNKSLVVSLIPPKSRVTQLYEVGFDGKIIRQLTFFKP